MKYLFDGCTPTVMELAHLNRYYKDNEFRVYAPDMFQLNGINITALTYSINTDIEGEKNQRGTYIAVPDGINIVADTSDKNSFYSTVDFEESLKWCDIYVSDLKESPEKATGNLKKAIKSGKEILFLHKAYKNALSDTGIVDKKVIAGLETSYKNFTYEKKPYVTFVTSTFESEFNGRLEACMELSRFLIENGEKVAILSTDNSARILQQNKLDVPVFTYNRDSSDLSVEDELKYVNLMIKCLSRNFNCDRIFIIGQSEFGVPNALTNTTKYLRDNMLVHMLGVDSVAVTSNPYTVLETERLVSYMSLTNKPVDCIYMYPVKGFTSIKIPGIDDRDTNVSCMDMYAGNRVLDAMMELKGNIPFVFMYTDYMSGGIQDTFDRWCGEPLGLSDFASKKLIYSMLDTLRTQRNIQSSKNYVNGHLTHQLTQVLKEKSGEFRKLDRKTYRKIMKKLKEADL